MSIRQAHRNRIAPHGGLWLLAFAMLLFASAASAVDCAENFRSDKDPATHAELFSTSVHIAGVRTSVERSSSDWGQATEQSRQSRTALPQTHPTIDQPGPAPPGLFPAV
jgi:hypothetical protein